MYFADVPANTGEIKWTSIGNKTRTISFPYSNIQGDIPGLQPPFMGYKPWGENLNNWFESYNNLAGTVPNAIMFIGSVFGRAGDDTALLRDRYLSGDYRIVVEAIYYFRPITWKQTTMVRNNSTFWIYGTIRNIAQYLNIPAIAQLVSETPYYGGGRWIGIFTNGDFATALKLVETDEYSGFGPPTAKKGNSSGEGGWLLYSDITAPKQGWGMHVVYRDKVEEQWATYDASAYGGSIGESPGSAPEMPSIPTTTTSWRKVSIVKFYEEAVKRSDGRTVYRTVSGPYKRDQICRTIEVQNEPGWVLKEFTQTQADHGWELYGNINKRDKNHTGTQAATVEVDIDRNN